MHPVDKALIPDNLADLSERSRRRMMDLLLKTSESHATLLPHSDKSWSLDFCLNPTRFVARADDASKLSHIELERTTLTPSAFETGARAVGTGETVQMPSSLAFESIGYKAAALPEFADLGILFDASRGTIGNDGSGRVRLERRTPDAAMSMAPFPGLYCSGWVKNGPTGVIVSTFGDASATGDAIADDWHANAPFLSRDKTPAGWEGVKEETKSTHGARVVMWSDWQKIDQAERERGQQRGKPREKFTKTADMLAVLG
jgi:adrenodoxin-NADP+ reductase